jgi:hypothetical protein
MKQTTRAALGITNIAFSFYSPNLLNNLAKRRP